MRRHHAHTRRRGGMKIWNSKYSVERRKYHVYWSWKLNEEMSKAEMKIPLYEIIYLTGHTNTFFGWRKSLLRVSYLSAVKAYAAAGSLMARLWLIELRRLFFSRNLWLKKVRLEARLKMNEIRPAKKAGDVSSSIFANGETSKTSCRNWKKSRSFVPALFCTEMAAKIMRKNNKAWRKICGTTEETLSTWEKWEADDIMRRECLSEMSESRRWRGYSLEKIIWNVYIRRRENSAEEKIFSKLISSKGLACGTAALAKERSLQLRTIITLFEAFRRYCMLEESRLPRRETCIRKQRKAASEKKTKKL